MVASPQRSVLCERATEIWKRSSHLWGSSRSVHLVGQDAATVGAIERLHTFAQTDAPVLITGESGVGKELFARSLFVLGGRSTKPFVSVNCAQYQKGDTLLSELFGHKKGSFTGATTDRMGVFEAADKGVLFLDEVGELSLEAQAMLLRAIGEGEIRSLGSTETRHVDVQVIAATNRPLEHMVAEKTFRADLFYRLRYLHLAIPPLRDRGDDWKRLAEFFLFKLNRKHRTKKQFSPSSWTLLASQEWRGNVREVRSIVEMGFCLATDDVIRPEHFRDGLGPIAKPDPKPSAVVHVGDDVLVKMVEEGEDFWSAVRRPFLDRDLNRSQVRKIVKRGLDASGGSYKKMLDIFRVQQDDYLKFMDFLRHHRLKPHRKAS